MKLNGRVLVAVAMMVGSFGAVGCARSADQGSTQVSPPAATTNDNTSNTATRETTSPGIRQDANGNRYAQPMPPALLNEVPGTAPSTSYIWQRGYWRWDLGRALYVWAPGYWENPNHHVRGGDRDDARHGDRDDRGHADGDHGRRSGPRQVDTDRDHRAAHNPGHTTTPVRRGHG